HRHRAQPRACGRRGQRPSRGVASREDRRALHSRRAGCLVLADAARYRRPSRQPRGTVRLPWRALIPVAFIAEAVANVTGREPFATLDGVHMAKYRMFFASTKAEQELGYRSRRYT